MGDKAPLWNDRYRLQALKYLIRTLPDPGSPEPKREPRSVHGIAKRLKEAQVKDLIGEYQAGATVYELGDRYGIDRKTVSKILRREGIEGSLNSGGGGWPRKTSTRQSDCTQAGSQQHESPNGWTSTQTLSSTGSRSAV